MNGVVFLAREGREPLGNKILEISITKVDVPLAA
jgi:hypothetical protein